MKPPCPRAPTTSSSASLHWSSSTCVLPPSIASQVTFTPGAAVAACSRAVSQMRAAIVCDASTEASTPTSLGVYQGDG